MRRHARDDHEGPQAHARDRGGARRGRAGSSSRRRLTPTPIAAVFERAASTYDRVAFPFFTPFGEALVEFASIERGERVLDVGCGAGAVLVPASGASGSVTGIELAPAMAERAREAAPSAEVIVGDAGALPFGDGEFDVVVAGFAVFFLADPTAALREWTRVLAPGGRLVMSTWGTADPRWTEWERPLRGSFVGDMEPALARELGAGLGLISRFDEPGKVQAELRAAGVEPGAVVEHAIEFAFADEQAWWDWNLSHGSRAYIEALSADARERWRAQMAAALSERMGDGPYPRTYTALFSRGSVAAGRPSV